MEIAIVLMLLGAAVFFVLPPLLRPDSETTVDETTVDGTTDAARREAISARESSYRALADLEMDLAAGKVSAADHAHLLIEHQRSAAAALLKLEAMDSQAASDPLRQPGNTGS